MRFGYNELLYQDEYKYFGVVLADTFAIALDPFVVAGEGGLASVLGFRLFGRRLFFRQTGGSC